MPSGVGVCKSGTDFPVARLDKLDEAFSLTLGE
jgi:hypothetical protein